MAYLDNADLKLILISNRISARVREYSLEAKVREYSVEALL